MKDLIERQAAIDHWRLIIDATNTDSRYNMGFVDGLEFCISHLSTMPSAQPEQRWIPCSERLPEVGTYVLVSKKALGFRSNLPNVCTAHRSRNPRSGKEEWNDMLFGKLDDDDVFAWMPLPEPYQKEGE